MSIKHSLTPEQRSARARHAANTRVSRHGGAAVARAARQGFLRSFAKYPDPEAALRRHMSAMIRRRWEAYRAAKAADLSARIDAVTDSIDTAIAEGHLVQAHTLRQILAGLESEIPIGEEASRE